MRPFSASAEVQCRGYSEGLQRAMSDFGAENAFAGAAAKLKEHYGIAVPVSAVRMVTEEHGAAMRAQEKQKSAWPESGGVAGVPVLIAEIDGSMLPVVETAEPGAGEAQDRRKTRQVSWKEARLALAHAPGSVTPIFGATLGSAEEAGERLAVCALQAGAGHQTKIHGVGDGAVWITEQMEVQFGTQAKYLVDFPHVCEYLSAAGEVIAGNNKPDCVLGTGQHPRSRCSGSCLLSLHLQPLEFPGLQGCPSRRPAHRFGRDRECPPLCVPEAAQDLRCLVEDGKFKKGDRSTRATGERRLGRLLEQPASGGCIN